MLLRLFFIFFFMLNSIFASWINDVDKNSNLESSVLQHTNNNKLQNKHIFEFKVQATGNSSSKVRKIDFTWKEKKDKFIILRSKEVINSPERLKDADIILKVARKNHIKYKLKDIGGFYFLIMTEKMMAQKDYYFNKDDNYTTEPVVISGDKEYEIKNKDVDTKKDIKKDEEKNEQEEVKHIIDLSVKKLTNNAISISFKPFKEETNFSVFRSQERISLQDIAEKNWLIDIRQSIYTDRALEPGVYYYAVMVKKGNDIVYDFLPNVNFTTQGIKIEEILQQDEEEKSIESNKIMYTSNYTDTSSNDAISKTNISPENSVIKRDVDDASRSINDEECVKSSETNYTKKKKKKTDQTSIVIEKLIAKEPDYIRALQYYGDKKYHYAISMFNKILSSSTDNFVKNYALLFKAKSCFFLKDYRTAISNLLIISNEIQEAEFWLQISYSSYYDLKSK